MGIVPVTENTLTVKDNEKDIALLKEMLLKINRFLFGNGENQIGHDENFRELVRRMGVVESNTEEALKIARRTAGTSGVLYDGQSHPSRRKSDNNRGISDRFIMWFGNQVAPGLLQAVIIFSFSFGFWLLVSNWDKFSG